MKDGKWGGYRPPEAFTAQLKELQRTNFVYSAATAVGDIVMIIVCATIAQLSWVTLPPMVSSTMVCFALWMIAYYLRGLECLVHESSHWNWSRRRSILNDRIANLLSGYPVFSSVPEFRPSHSEHHNRLRSKSDPCQERHLEGGLASLDRGSLTVFIGGLIRLIGPYIISWWRLIGTKKKTIAASIGWHVITIILPLTLLFGLRSALTAWGVYFMLPFFFVLPWLRMIGEAAEHEYLGEKPMFDATISNIGIIHLMLIHPHGDGFHLLHHMYPCIPHHRLKRAHQLLVKLDPDGYGARHRHRTSILQDPVAGYMPSSNWYTWLISLWKAVQYLWLLPLK